MPFRAKRFARRLGNTLKTTSRKGIKTLNRTGVEQAKWQAASSSLAGMGIYSGFGKYTPKKKRKRSAPRSQGAVTNSLIAGSDVMIPSFTSAGDETGGITISRKEYLGDVFCPGLVPGSTTEIPAFSNTTYSINPGVERSFPWLSQIAQNFEEYTLHQLIYTYRSTITDLGASQTGQCGTCVMCTTYNIGNTPFEDKITMMEYEGAMSSKCSDSMLHGVECDPDKLSGSPGKYVRANGFANGNLNGRDYDHGLFQIAVANPPKEYANQTIGELWVTYTVSLRKPKFFVGRGFGISQDVFVNTPSSLQPRIDKNLLMGTASPKQYLVGELNNLRTQLTAVTSGATAGQPAYDKRLNDIQAVTAYTAFTSALKITFPGSVTGYFEIAVFMRMRNTSSSAAGAHTWTGSATWGNFFWLSPDVTGLPTGAGAINGNINYIKDIYAGVPTAINTNAGNAPTSYEAVPIAGQSHGYFRCHIFVRPASNGQENYILLPYNPSVLTLTAEGTGGFANDGSIMSVSLTVTEYNAAFSYRANNIGPEAPGTQSVDTMYIDTTGNRVVPSTRS